MHIKIVRWGSTPMGVFGKIEIWNDMELVYEGFTVEKPWENNVPFKSCVPVGIYKLEEHSSDKYGDNCYAIVGGTVSHWEAPGFERYTCLFHIANTSNDVVGCIGIGTRLGSVGKRWAVVTSGPKIREFNDLLHSVDEEHTLEIQWEGYKAA